jgi:hypothetical protein
MSYLKALLICITIVLLILPVRVYPDLLTDYMDATVTEDHISWSNAASSYTHYRTNINLYPPDYSSGNVKLFDLGVSAGVDAGSCGAFSLFGDMKALINNIASTFESQAKGIITGLINSLPLVVACAISQDLCDAYKYYRAQANMLAKLSRASCERIEQLAMNAGSYLRSEAIRECVAEKKNSGISIIDAMNECSGAQEIRSLSGQGKVKKYSLTEELRKLGVDSDVVDLIGELLGDIEVDTSIGVGAKEAPMYTTEKLINREKKEIEKALNNQVESYSGPGSVSPEERKEVSIPGAFVFTDSMYEKLKIMNEETRRMLISQYATIAATFRVAIRLQDAIEHLQAVSRKQDATETEKQMAKQAVEELRQRLDILLKKMEIQAEYMDRVVKAIEEYEGSPTPPYRRTWDTPQGVEILPVYFR